MSALLENIAFRIVTLRPAENKVKKTFTLNDRSITFAERFPKNKNTLPVCSQGVCLIENMQKPIKEFLKHVKEHLSCATVIITS